MEEPCNLQERKAEGWFCPTNDQEYIGMSRYATSVVKLTVN